jgi:hypothetical protein
MKWLIPELIRAERRGMAEQLDPKQAFVIRQAIAEARAADATAQRLEESYVRLLVLANAGGLIACLGIADALAGRKGSPATLSFAALAGLMWFFLFGLIFGGIIVSFQRARAVQASEKHGRGALQVIKDMGLIVPTPPSAFSRTELKGLPHLTTAISIASPTGFLVGAIWGLLRIAAVHCGWQNVTGYCRRRWMDGIDPAGRTAPSPRDCHGRIRILHRKDLT